MHTARRLSLHRTLPPAHSPETHRPRRHQARKHHVFSFHNKPHFVLIDFGAAVYLKDAADSDPSGTPSHVVPEFLQRRRGAETDVRGTGSDDVKGVGEGRTARCEVILPGIFKVGSENREALLRWFGEVCFLRGELDGKGVEGLERKMLEVEVGVEMDVWTCEKAMRGVVEYHCRCDSKVYVSQR